MRWSTFIVACAALTGSPVAAGPLASGGVTVQEVAAVLQDAGYKAAVGRDDEGDPTIDSAAEGVNYDVLFYDCEAGRCKSIQFTAGFDMKDGTSLVHVNDWNKRFRFGQVYVDDENDPYLSMDLDLEDGVTTELLKSNLLRWVDVLNHFKEHIDW